MKRKNLGKYFSDQTIEVLWGEGEIDPTEALIAYASECDTTRMLSDSKTERGYIDYTRLTINCMVAFTGFCKAWNVQPRSEYALHYMERFAKLDRDDPHDLYQNLSVLWERLFLDLFQAGRFRPPPDFLDEHGCYIAAIEIVNVLLYRSLTK